MHMPSQRIVMACTYPYVLWESKKQEGIPLVRIIRADPKNLAFEEKLQDAMGQDCWVPISDGNILLASALAALNQVADRVHVQGWFRDGMVQ